MVSEDRLREEILRLFREDPGFRSEVISLLEERLVSRREFALIVEELRSLRESFNRGFAELSRRLEQLYHIVEEHSRRLEEHSRRLEGLYDIVREHSRRMEEFSRTLSSVGARWGVLAEEAFRRGLRGLVSRILGVDVRPWRWWDADGMVYGHPSWVEADVAISDTEHILVEIKSSISRGDVGAFYRVGELYARTAGVRPRLVMVSPFVDEPALGLAGSLGIEVHTSMRG